jgi:hypothetical protein
MPLVFVMKLPVHQTDLTGLSDHTDLVPDDISCIVLRLHLDINFSTGFIIASRRANMHRLLVDFQSDFSECPHPLSMLVKFCQTQADALVRRIDQLDLTLHSNSQTSLLGITLLHISTRLALSEENRRSCKNLLAFLHEQLQWLRDISEGTPQQGGRQTLIDNLENRLEILRSSVNQLPSYDSLKFLIQSRQDYVCPFGPEPVITSEAYDTNTLQLGYESHEDRT